MSNCDHVDFSVEATGRMIMLIISVALHCTLQVAGTAVNACGSVTLSVTSCGV
jgi:hypothetical protein